ncbi:hypothetical protein ACE6H2_024663 [Prunus campanulata]
MTFGKQNKFPESFGLLDQAFLSGTNFFDSTEMYPVVQRAQTQGRGRSEERRFGHQGCKVDLRYRYRLGRISLRPLTAGLVKQTDPPWRPDPPRPAQAA